MGSCRIIKQKCSSFLYLQNKVLFRKRPIMHNVHYDILLSPSCMYSGVHHHEPAAHTKPMSHCVHLMVAFNRKLGFLEKHIIRR